MFKKQTYPVDFTLIIRSEGDTTSRDIDIHPKYYIYYSKTYEMPIPPAVGTSIFVWKQIKIKEIHIKADSVFCLLEEQILPYVKFDKLMQEYRFELMAGNWKEEKNKGIRPL
jgi:hypothetical protein